MADVDVSPSFPAWMLDGTFEGRILNAWLGHYGRDGQVEFSGDTDPDGEDNIKGMRLDADGVAELLSLAKEAGTHIGDEVARLLSDPEGNDLYNGYGEIDVGAIQMGVEIAGGGSRMMDVDDLIQSLVARFPEQIPYAQVAWKGGGTFITPDGIEWFKGNSKLDKRREEYLASLPAPTRKP
jgi:hypothetical protein